jgi:hypothetical protein
MEREKEGERERERKRERERERKRERQRERRRERERKRKRARESKSRKNAQRCELMMLMERERMLRRCQWVLMTAEKQKEFGRRNIRRGHFLIMLRGPADNLPSEKNHLYMWNLNSTLPSNHLRRLPYI